LNCIGEIKQEL